MERRVAVRAIIANEIGQLLCVRLKDYKSTGGGGGVGDFWVTIGGSVDPGEALEPALSREVLEETGVAAKIGNLLYVQQYLHGGKEHLEFFFNVTNPEDFVNIDLTKTSHGVEEIARIDFIDPTKETVKPEFLMSETLVGLSNAQTKFFNYL